MPDPSRLAFFVVAALALLLVPGPAVLYVVTQSIDQGRRAGLASVGGIFSGTLVHIAAATVGLSALLASSAVAFDVVKYAGAAYLIVVGLRACSAASPSRPGAAGARRSLGRLYRQGIVVNVLNPKTALFFLAFLPQFVDPARGAAWAADPPARPPLRVPRRPDRRDLGARRRHVRRVAPRQPPLPAGAALRVGLGVRRARRGRGVLRAGQAELGGPQILDEPGARGRRLPLAADDLARVEPLLGDVEEREQVGAVARVHRPAERDRGSPSASSARSSRAAAAAALPACSHGSSSAKWRWPTRASSSPRSSRAGEQRRDPAQLVVLRDGVQRVRAGADEQDERPLLLEPPVDRGLEPARAREARRQVALGERRAARRAGAASGPSSGGRRCAK